MAITLHMIFQPYSTAPSYSIEVSSVSFDAEQTLNIGSTASGAGAGKVTFNPFGFAKKPDIHSAEFWSRLCSGTAFQKVSLNAISSGATIPSFSFTMGLVAIKTMSFSASENDGNLSENITLEYGQCAYSVTPQNPDGTFGKAVASGWDRLKNIAEDPTNVGMS